MIQRSLLVGGLALMLVACGGSPEPTGEPAPLPVGDATEAPAEAAAPDAAPDAAPEASGEENLAQPEWDALDRVADSCGMSAVRGFVGRLASEIPEERLPERVRILAPGDQATMDYVPRRLNVLTNEDGLVIGLRCG